MSEVLMFNPAKRRRTRKNPSAAQLRARRAFAAAARARSANPKRRRRRNPAPVVMAQNPRPRRRAARRRNPITVRRYAAARRRNPSLGGLGNSVMSVLKQSAMQGIGAVAFDFGYAKLATYLPASMQATPGQLTMGTISKLVLTAAVGKVLSRSTKGYSKVAATGSLTCQFRDLVNGMVPGLSGVGAMGYAIPNRVVNYNARVGPNNVRPMGRLTTPGGPSPLLSAPMGRLTARGAQSPLLSARSREGMHFR